MVGESRQSVAGPTVEAGKVEELARAVYNDDPAYRSAAAAAARVFDRIPAPLTFLRTALFPRYGPGEPATDVDRFPMGFDIGFDTRYRVHGEQASEIDRPLFVGDTPSGTTTTLTDVSQREKPDRTLTIPCSSASGTPTGGGEPCSELSEDSVRVRLRRGDRVGVAVGGGDDSPTGSY